MGGQYGVSARVAQEGGGEEPEGLLKAARCASTERLTGPSFPGWRSFFNNLEESGWWTMNLTWVLISRDLSPEMTTDDGQE